jgi:stage II sporulation protein D
MRITGRTIAALLVMLVVIGATATASAHARASAQYRIEGRGWGHGIGMSQYGANGYAEQGWTSDQIIQHYYQGTVVAPRPADGPTSLRVLLQSYLDPGRIAMVSDGMVRQGSATLPLLAGDIVHMRASGRFLIVTRIRTGTKNEILSAASSTDATIVPAIDGGARILFDADHAGSGTAFRGTLSGHVFEGKVSVYNTVPFEQYLRGVVPDEMPPSWKPEALEAQAIAARSYALRSLRTTFNWFDVYSDTRSQVYGGMGAEEESTDAAIAATDGLVARVGGADGEVAQTFFFSTSGGRTAGNDQVWGSSPYSYLRPVPSPFETASPYFFWKGADIRRYTPAGLGSALGAGTGFRSASTTVYPSGYADDVVVRSVSGTSTTSASSVQARLGLRSTFFRIQYLSIIAPDSTATGGFVTLRGRVPTSGRTQLLLRRDGATKAVALTPTGPLGAWTVRTRMTGDMTATLARSGITGPRVFVLATTAPPIVGNRRTRR